MMFALSLLALMLLTWATISGTFIAAWLIISGLCVLIKRGWRKLHPAERQTEPIRLPEDDIEWLRATLAALDEEEQRL